MALKAILISAGDTWVAPATVSGVFLYEVGGGSGANCSDDGSGRNSGGAGSAEYCGMKPVKVVPGDSYVVTIGGMGVGGLSDFSQIPIPGGYSSFAGFKALTGGIYRGGAKTGADNAGDGGGAGGGQAIAGGDGGVWPDPVPKQEAMHYWGGAGGGGPGIYGNTCASSGGNLGQEGATVSGQPGGGGSGGSIWGTTNGAAGVEGSGGPRKANASPTHYGAGAGGTGGGDVGGSDGGNGAGGCVVLMWFE